MSKSNPPKGISRPCVTASASRIAVVAFGISLASIAPAQSSVVTWAKEKVVSRIKAFGERRITYHIRDVEGDRDAYNVTNDGGFGDRKITDLGYLRFEGRNVFDILNFDANIQDSRFTDPQAQRYRLWIDRNGFTAEYGDIRGTLPSSNRFVQVTNNVSGLSLGYRSGPLRVGLLRTEARGEARTVSLPGNNSAGPYYLQSNQIIRGSERIEVDGVLQVFGQDYTIDYDLGAVTFLNRTTLESKIIAPTSTIVATYESFNFAGSAGRIEGASLQYSMGKAGTIGFIGARQVTGAGSQLSTRLEKFQGFGPASTPYFLQFQPMPGEPIIVRVDGVLQTEGIDYHFDPGNPSIFYFNRFMPANSNIDVLYTPKPSQNVPGDREVVGIDYVLPIGKGDIRLSQATGRSRNTPTASSGTARGASIRYGTGPWDFQANYRDIPEGYVSIQSAGFNRNERANDFTVGLKAGRDGKFTAGNFNSSILSYTNNGINTTVNRTRFTRSFLTYALTRDPKAGFPLQLGFTRTHTSNAAGDTKVDVASLSTNRIFGRLVTGLSLEHQNVTGRQEAQVLSTRLNTSYDPSRQWQFTLGAGINQIKTPTQSGTGHDVQLSTRYTPSDNLFLRLSHSESDSGRVNFVPGINSGYGTGFDGNGFTSGSGSQFTAGATNGRQTNLVARYEPTPRIGLRANAGIYRSSGSVSSNATTRSLSFGIDYDLGAGHFLGGDLDFSATSFDNLPVRSNATSLNGFVNGQFGKFGYRAGGSLLLSSGSQYAQDNFAFNLALDYRLDSRQNLVLNANYGRITGYLPQNQFDASLVYQYQIWQNLAINVRYNISDIANRDPFQQTGAYRARTLDFELAFNFGR